MHKNKTERNKAERSRAERKTCGYKWKTFLGFMIVIAGIGIYLYPNIREWEMEWQTKKLIEEFEKEYHDGDGECSTISNEELTEPGKEDEETQGNGSLKAESEPGLYVELYKKMLEYNEDLAENGQELVDAWSYTQEPIDLDGLMREDGAVGYIQIPAMDVTLPLYIGADTENLSKGAAVLGETSMPIGGANTNCVIAGHRGYSGMPYFREIERLQTGDVIYVTNLWETMIYIVEEIRVVNPDDVESILIAPGRDLITLLTCHPYMSHGKYRYVVVCGRTEEEKQTGANETGENETEASAANWEGTLETGQTDSLQEDSAAGFTDVLFGWESISELRIVLEKALRILIPAMMLDLLAARCLRKRNEKRLKPSSRNNDASGDCPNRSLSGPQG